MLYCKFCNYYTNTKLNLEEHFETEQHESSLKKNGFITCDSCYFFSKDEKKFKEHLLKKEHLEGKKLQDKEANNEKDKIINMV
tara:strand:+ start:39 stop:287 length:249 start_codon:yes stop_codon:yes gene_type:complete